MGRAPGVLLQRRRPADGPAGRERSGALRPGAGRRRARSRGRLPRGLRDRNRASAAGGAHRTGGRPSLSRRHAPLRRGSAAQGAGSGPGGVPRPLRRVLSRDSAVRRRQGGRHHPGAGRHRPRLPRGRGPLASHHPLRRPKRPRHGQARRVAHLLPARRGLPHVQVGTGLPPRRQRSGLGPPQHRGPGPRGLAGPGTPRGLSRVRAAPNGHGGAGGRRSPLLQASRIVHHAGRPGGGNGRGRGALFFLDAPPGSASDLRLGRGVGSVRPEPRVQGPVRPRPLVQA